MTNFPNITNNRVSGRLYITRQEMETYRLNSNDLLRRSATNLAEGLVRKIAEKCTTFAYEPDTDVYVVKSDCYAFTQEELDTLLAKTYDRAVKDSLRIPPPAYPLY